jgi:hypothetical protein
MVEDDLGGSSWDLTIEAPLNHDEQWVWRWLKIGAFSSIFMAV